MAEVASPTTCRSTSSSPPPKCAICLGTCTNKCYSNSCMHQFCFTCLLEWSKVKPECPLCKQGFKSIIHNIKSNSEYDEHIITRPELPLEDQNMHENQFLYIPPAPSRHFQFRTTFTVDPRGELAIQQMLLSHPLTNNFYIPGAFSRRLGWRTRRASSATTFRRAIYAQNLWVYAPPDITGRYRNISPSFFRENPVARNRLVPWLNRELNALLHENTQRVMHLVDVIMEHLLRHHIRSRNFRNLLSEYLGNKTDHFIHEFYNFMRSPFDMIGYDRHVIYTDRPESPPYSVSDYEDDSDVAIVNESQPVTADNNPFRSPTIEVIEINSDSSHDSDVIIREPTPPEVVDLVQSDTSEDFAPPRQIKRSISTESSSSSSSSSKQESEKPILPLKLRLKRKRQSREKNSFRLKKRHKRSRTSSSSSTSSRISSSSDSSTSTDSSTSSTDDERNETYRRNSKYKRHKRKRARKMKSHKTYKSKYVRNKKATYSNSDSSTDSSKCALRKKRAYHFEPQESLSGSKLKIKKDKIRKKSHRPFKKEKSNKSNYDSPYGSVDGQAFDNGSTKSAQPTSNCSFLQESIPCSSRSNFNPAYNSDIEDMNLPLSRLKQSPYYGPLEEQNQNLSCRSNCNSHYSSGEDQNVSFASNSNHTVQYISDEEQNTAPSSVSNFNPPLSSEEGDRSFTHSDWKYFKTESNDQIADNMSGQESRLNGSPSYTPPLQDLNKTSFSEDYGSGDLKYVPTLNSLDYNSSIQYQHSSNDDENDFHNTNVYPPSISPNYTLPTTPNSPNSPTAPISPIEDQPSIQSPIYQPAYNGGYPSNYYNNNDNSNIPQGFLHQECKTEVEPSNPGPSRGRLRSVIVKKENSNMWYSRPFNYDSDSN